MARRHQTRRNLGTGSGCAVAAENMSSIWVERMDQGGSDHGCLCECAQSRGCQECLGRRYAGGGCYSSGFFEGGGVHLTMRCLGWPLRPRCYVLRMMSGSAAKGARVRKAIAVGDQPNH